jgi:diaminopimelate decarboxylase
MQKYLSMHFFRYIQNELYAEDIPVRELINEYGSPLYIYSYKTLVRHFKAYDDSFDSIPHLICYAVKANSNLSILRLLGSLGSGADIVSGGELYRATKAGIRPSRIVYAGVGKTEEEIDFALKKGILMFNVESEQELKKIDEVAGRLSKRARIALRINPDIDPETHPYISTGLKEHKFGIPIEEALEHYRLAKSLKNIDVVGVHKHIGSQITSAQPFVDALKRVLILVEELKKEDINIRYLDIGGGLGIQYESEKPPHPKELAKRLLPILRDSRMTLILEPGRSIVGNAGILVTRVLYTKPGLGKEFVIVDAAMNDLMRPTLYGAYHRIVPVKKVRRKGIIADIVGPICESGDFLAREREIPQLKPGELIAVMSAGAYGFSMSSNYNSRPRVAEVMVKGKEHYLIRERETYKDLIRGERLVEV